MNVNNMFYEDGIQCKLKAVCIVKQSEIFKLTLAINIYFAQHTDIYIVTEHFLSTSKTLRTNC